MCLVVHAMPNNSLPRDLFRRYNFMSYQAPHPELPSHLVSIGQSFFAASERHPGLLAMIDYLYTHREYFRDQASYVLEHTGPIAITKVFEEIGLLQGPDTGIAANSTEGQKVLVFSKEEFTNHHGYYGWHEMCHQWR